MNETETDQSDVIVYDDLDVDSDGFVTGSAHTREKDGHRVQASVTSYEYDDGQKMNHVPLIAVTDETGSIYAHPTAPESVDPKTAIENARAAAEHAFKNLSQYVA